MKRSSIALVWAGKASPPRVGESVFLLRATPFVCEMLGLGRLLCSVRNERAVFSREHSSFLCLAFWGGCFNARLALVFHGNPEAGLSLKGGALRLPAGGGWHRVAQVSWSGCTGLVSFFCRVEHRSAGKGRRCESASATQLKTVLTVFNCFCLAHW